MHKKESREKNNGKKGRGWERKKRVKLSIIMGSYQSAQVRGTKLQNFF
jgi:hypothetical protein